MSLNNLWFLHTFIKFERAYKVPHCVNENKAVQVYEGGSKSFRPDIQKPRQMKDTARDIQGVPK